MPTSNVHVAESASWSQAVSPSTQVWCVERTPRRLFGFVTSHSAAQVRSALRLPGVQTRGPLAEAHAPVAGMQGSAPLQASPSLQSRREPAQVPALH
jgi:hypothetical protein